MRYACPVPSNCGLCAAAPSRATSCTVPRLPRSSHMVCIVRTDTVVNAGAVARSGIRGRSTVGLLFDGRRVDCGARRRRVRQRLCGRGESPRVRASSPADIVSGGVLDTGARVLPAKMASGEKTRYIRKVSRYAAALRAVASAKWRVGDVLETMAFISRQKQLGKSLVAINGPSIHRYARRTVDSLRPTPILCNSTHLKAVTSHATPHRMGAFRRTALSSTRARDHFLSLWRGQAHRGHIAPDLPSHADQAAHSYVAETLRERRYGSSARSTRRRPAELVI